MPDQTARPPWLLLRLRSASTSCRLVVRKTRSTRSSCLARSKRPGTRSSMRPMKPTSSSSTRARSSMRRKKRASTPSSRWPSSRRTRREEARRHRLPRAALLGRAREGHPGDRSHPRLERLPVDLEGPDAAEGERPQEAADGDVGDRHRDARVHLRPRRAARAHRQEPLGLREGRRRLRSAVLVLHHPEAARPAALAPDRRHRRRGRAARPRRRPRGEPDRAGPHALRLGRGQHRPSRARRSPSCSARWARSTASSGSVSTTRSRARSTTI